MPDLGALLSDLRAEHDELDAVVSELDDASWDTPTPAEGWSIRDQISHLSFFDHAARLAAADPDAFTAGLQEAAADINGYIEAPIEEGRAYPVSRVLALWRERRAHMLGSFEGLTPEDRILWYGPPMGAASFISARLMETWAHGQDVFDALRRRREPTERLRHICFLGVRARGFSYVANGREVPNEDVRVELRSPGDELWTWGASDSNIVTGSAEGFCLLVTQRRHLDDTDLVAEGPLAAEWLTIAQCFAGPPGPGRAPGQFPWP